MGLKPLKTLFFWFSRRFFLFSLVSFCIFGFLEGFVGFVKTFGKTNKTKTNKPISKGGSETFKNFILFVFPNVFLVFFGFLWYLWFSRKFVWFSHLSNSVWLVCVGFCMVLCKFSRFACTP